MSYSLLLYHTVNTVCNHHPGQEMENYQPPISLFRLASNDLDLSHKITTTVLTFRVITTFLLFFTIKPTLLNTISFAFFFLTSYNQRIQCVSFMCGFCSKFYLYRYSFISLTVVHSFLPQHKISLYEYTLIYLSIPSLKDIQAVSTFQPLQEMVP